MASFFLREDPLLLFSISSRCLCSLSNGPAMMLSIYRCKETREICRSHLGHLLLFDPSASFLSPLIRGAHVHSFPLLIIRNGISRCFGKKTFIGSQPAQEMPFCLHGYVNMTFKISGNIPSTNSIRTHQFDVCLDSHRLRSHKTER